jgi:hypothetical protein
LGDLTGKNIAVFCTYKLAAGSTLAQMSKALEEKGANVTEEFKFRGPIPNDEFFDFVASLT